MTREEKLETVVKLAVDMREKQRAYFRTRSREALVASKAAEQAFDTMAAVLDRPDLFP